LTVATFGLFSTQNRVFRTIHDGRRDLAGVAQAILSILTEQPAESSLTTARNTMPKQPDLLILKLIEKLDDADPLIRRNAAGALRMQGMRAVAAIPALSALLTDLDPRVRNEAERALDHLRLTAA
jgi:HEAT repeat protein